MRLWKNNKFEKILGLNWFLFGVSTKPAEEKILSDGAEVAVAEAAEAMSKETEWWLVVQQAWQRPQSHLLAEGQP